VDQRLQFLSSYQKEEMSVTDLCHEYGISRPTAYKWIKRYDEVGPEGLLDLTRKPHGCSHATPAEIENEVLALRKRFPSWGARKLKARLERMNPNVLWPAASTVGQILSRAGLTNPKRKKRRTTPYSQPFSMADPTDIAIRRYAKVKSDANPFDPLWCGYFESRTRHKGARLRRQPLV